MRLSALNDNGSGENSAPLRGTWLVFARDSVKKWMLFRARSNQAELVAMQPHPQCPHPPAVEKPAPKKKGSHLSVVQ